MKRYYPEYTSTMKLIEKICPIRKKSGETVFIGSDDCKYCDHCLASLSYSGVTQWIRCDNHKSLKGVKNELRTTTIRQDYSIT